MKHEIFLNTNNGKIAYENSRVTLECENDSCDTRFSMTIKLTEWEGDAYVFMPACVYDGNRFKKSFCSYPPMYQNDELGICPAPVIADIPALNPDGSGKIQVTSGDLSVPCVGVYYKNKKEGFFVFCEQECMGKNIGFSISSGEIEIQFPVIRTGCYRMCRTNEISTDSGIVTLEDEKITSSVIIKEFECSSISEFFKCFFENRKLLLSNEPCKAEYTPELWDILERHMNNDNFSGEYYAETSKKYQLGWVGGGMSSLPLLQYGNETSKANAIKTLDFITSNIAPSGFFYTMIENDVIKDDGFNNEHMKSAMLTRKCGDGLYFLLKHFDVVTPKEEWINAARNCANAFVRLYNRYDDFGQFVNIETGEMMFGGTTSGSSIISALVKAYRFFNDEKYLRVAKSAGKKYYNDFIAKGLTYGGPGEALCAPDSESCYAMVEATVLLYEATQSRTWLDYATDSLHLLSSWVMTYSYRFPRESEFARLKINTVGSVFANAQNKHSAPGLCTSSGDAIYKIYKYTKNEKYLELLYDIVSFIPQCVSTQERPIHSWDREPKVLKSGWICERVNTSDWEGKNGIGGVFYGSCWCETSLLLTYSEIIKNDEIRKALRI